MIIEPTFFELSLLSSVKMFCWLMLLDSKTCFLFRILSLRTVMGVKLLRTKWEIHNKVDWQKTNRQKEKNKNQIKKITVLSKTSSINYGWSKICSFAWNCKFIWCDNIIHTFWFIGNDFYYRLKQGLLN